MADYSENQGFHMQSADTTARQTDVQRHAAALLEDIRVNQKQMRQSADAQERANHRIRSQAAQLQQAAYAMWSHLVSPIASAGDSSAPPPAFYFQPMATAPACRLLFAESRTTTAPTLTGSRRASAPLHAEVGDDRPKWNASTLLTEEEPNTRDGSFTFRPRRQPVNASRPSEAPAHRSAVAGGTTHTGRASPRSATVEAPPLLRRVDPSTARQDAEREKAVRDYLRRMNILHCDRTDGAAGFPFSDALCNGAALCQLSHCVFGAASSVQPSPQDPVLCRSPTSLSDVQRNYTAVLGTLSDAVSRGDATVPLHLFRLSPEDVFLRSSLTTLVDLYVLLISQHLPSPEKLPSRGPEWLWQPPADAPIFAVPDAGELAAMEQRTCASLIACGVLPDPDTYGLPTDDCIVPGPLAASFIPDRKHFVARSEAPSTLYVPSVFPFLSNGFVLCYLARRSATAPLRAAPASTPRTKSNCVRNIVLGLKAFHSELGIPVGAIDTVAEAFYCGSRQEMLAVLCSISRVVELAGGRVLPPTSVAPPGSTSVARTDRPTSSTPKAEDATHRPAPAAGWQVAASELTSPRSVTPKEVQQLSGWLSRVLGPTFTYIAEDETFEVKPGEVLLLQEPCPIFSDGVVLAHLIRVLECRRCEALDSVQPTSKRPAKRFNIKRCLTFLEKERGFIPPLPLMDELLLTCDLKATVSLLRCIKGKYKS